MTTERFEFWERAFLAAIGGCNSGRPDDVINYAQMVASRALKVWIQTHPVKEDSPDAER